MYRVGKIENRYVVLGASLVLILIGGFIDHETGKELSNTLFYIVPIALLALYINTKVLTIVFCAVISSAVGFVADYSGIEDQHFFTLLWNSFIHLIVFASIGLLLYYLKEKHKKLKAANRKLLASNEEKSTYLGIAAHDLRNPISGIYSLSDLLLKNNKEKLDPEVTESLDYIKTLSNDALFIIRDLLNVARLESGKIELVIKAEDYITFVHQQIKLTELFAKQKGIQIRFQPLVKSLTADFDKNYMKEVILNLLTNAIKYSDQGSEIIVKVLLKDNDIVLTEVTDKGKGIADEEQKRLFRYFQTTSTQPTNGEQSTGLGLAISKQIISLHNGTVGLRSKLNEGSTFYFTFPKKIH